MGRDVTVPIISGTTEARLEAISRRLGTPAEDREPNPNRLEFATELDGQTTLNLDGQP